jgi:hypothetical protein
MRWLSDAEPLGKLRLEGDIEFCKLNVRLAHLVLFTGSIGVFTRPMQTHLHN